MADDIDAGISLNLTSYRKDRSKDDNKSKHVIGNRGQRIKARRNIRKLKEKSFSAASNDNNSKSISEFGDGSRNISHEDNHEADTNRSRAAGVTDKDAESGDKERGAKKKEGEVVSSLFRHNPDIPRVSSTSVQQAKEKLFTSDSFQEVPLHPYMISNLEKLGFSKMTSVQYETIPRLTEGHDLMVKSQTGSGKTMAYAIPVVEKLCRVTPKLQRSDGCQAIILVPTRELAIQSYEVFVKLLKPFTWIVAGCIMGGEKRKAEKARLRKGINILVATPGRLIDHIENTQSLGLANLQFLILDEADRLLDLGFEAKVAKIIQCIDDQQAKRQTVLLSATLTAGVERLAGISLKNPQKIAIDKNRATSLKKSSKIDVNSDGKHETSQDFPAKNDVCKDDNELRGKTKTSPENDKFELTEDEGDSFVLPESLQQYFVITPCKLRLVLLLTLIMTKCKKEGKMKMLVFISTQDGVEFLYKLLSHLSIINQSDSDVEDEETEVETSLDAYRLHGDMSQKDRTSTFQDFCTARSGVLLCTDVAARGLHLPLVQWVVQYSAPPGIPDYVHRVGRTARVGSAGQTLLFLMPSETQFVKHLNQKNISLSEMKVGTVLKDVMKLVPALPGMADTQRQVPRTVEEAATYLQNACEMYVKNNKTSAPLAKSAYQSYIRSYATYPHSLKHLFHVRHLHLGHVAKTFGLREAPSNIGTLPGVSDAMMSKKRKHDKDLDSRSGPHKKRRMDPVSEFRGALVFKKKTGKPKHKKQTIGKKKNFKKMKKT